MKISASIVADSINPRGSRLTTAVLTYPRIIHSEFMTHRAFSRNAASSRAIPIEKMLAAVEQAPAWPEQWGANKPGMQAGEPVQEPELTWCKDRLNDLRRQALDVVEYASHYGLHKQVANRYLEPWGWITVIATAADWGFANFFNLRAHPLADPTFQALAYRLLDAYMKSVPRQAEWNDWHIPFAAPVENWNGFGEETMDVVKQAVGRCARVSYLRQDMDEPEKNREIHDRLAAASPMHASAFEHVAQAAVNQDYVSNFDRLDWSPHYTGSGWEQYRKRFGAESITVLNADDLMAAKPAWLTL